MSSPKKLVDIEKELEERKMKEGDSKYKLKGQEFEMKRRKEFERDEKKEPDGKPS